MSEIGLLVALAGVWIFWRVIKVIMEERDQQRADQQRANRYGHKGDEEFQRWGL